MDVRELMTTAGEAARQGGQVLQDWRGRFGIGMKGHNDLITDADHAAQETVHKFLQARHPDFGFLGEESQGAATLRPEYDRPTWIVDPLDGTTNYAHGCPVYAVSIGLEHRGELLVGAIFDPNQQELFLAGRGQGAWLGDTRLSTTRCEHLAAALLSTGFPPDMQAHQHSLRTWEHFSLRTQSLRRTGSTSLNLAYVAAGRHDGFWTHQAWPWDAAAGVVLIREAGGIVSHLDSSPYNLYTQDILATNGPLHHEMVNAMREVAK